MSDATEKRSGGAEPQTYVMPLNVKLLALASLLNDIASETVYPLLPKFLLSTLGGNRFWLGAIEGLADSLASLLKIQFGAWSDRARNRKPFVVVGYLVAALARPLHAAVSTPSQLLSARLGDRFGKGVRTAARDALISDSSPPAIRGRAFGFHRAMDHLGAAIGPVLATLYLLVWPDALRSLFLLTAIPGAIVVIVLWCGLREPERHGSESVSGSSTPKPFDKNFIRFLVAMLLFTLGNSSDAFLLVRAEEVGVPVVYLPLLWAVFHVAKSVGNLIAGAWVDRIGPRTMLFVGWGFYATIYLAFAVATSRTAVIALFATYAVYYALTEPAEKTMVSLLVPRSRSGAAYGWFHGAIGFAALPSSMIFGGLYERWGYTIAFGFGALQAVIAMSVLLAVRSPCTNADGDGSIISVRGGD